MRKIFNNKLYDLNILTTSFLLESVEDIKKAKELTARQVKDGKVLLEWKKIKFDLVMGNPPFQEFGTSSGTLWDDFVMQSLQLVTDQGYLSFIHPSGWRNISGKFKNIQKEIFSRDLKYLEIHNEKDGLELFGKETRYDWYVVKNSVVNKTITSVKFQGEGVSRLNVHGLEFLPNGKFDTIRKLVAKVGEPRVDVLHSESDYETRKKWMSKTKTNEFNKPCVYTVNSEDEVTSLYSSKDNGHFGISKFIWSNGRISSIGSYIDDEGKYGLTQFAYAIVDKISILPKIKKAFDSPKFRELMEYCSVGQLTVNYKVIATFKKDFYKEF